MLDPLRLLPRLSMFMSRSCELNTVLRCSRDRTRRAARSRDAPVGRAAGQGHGVPSPGAGPITDLSAARKAAGAG